MPPELDHSERRELRRKARTATLAAIEALGGMAHRNAIHARALEIGPFSPLELAAPIPTSRMSRHTRLIDEKLSFALSDLKSDGLLDNPERGMWCLAGPARELRRPTSTARVDARRLGALRAMPYPEYLRTPEWERTRDAALWSAGYSCALDVTHTQELDVHHRTYDRRGEELPTDLIVLCRACHRTYHEQFGRPKRPSALAHDDSASTPPPAVDHRDDGNFPSRQAWVLQAPGLREVIPR